MGVEKDRHRRIFTRVSGFGTTARYQKSGAAALSIDGIFDAEHTLAGIGTTDVATVSPQLLVRSADLPAGAGDGDSVTVDSVAYAVRYAEPDGTGMTVLRLERT